MKTYGNCCSLVEYKSIPHHNRQNKEKASAFIRSNINNSIEIDNVGVYWVNGWR